MPEWGDYIKYDDIITARRTGRADDVYFFKTDTMGGVSGVWYSTFRNAGRPPAISPAGPPGSVMDSSSTGAIQLVNLPEVTQKYLLSAGFSTTNANLSVIMLVDLLVAVSGINANTTSVQTINTPMLHRYFSGEGVLATLAVTTTLGGTASTATITYVNHLGTSGRTSSLAMVASAAVHRLAGGSMPFFPLQGADKGIQSVQNIQFSAAMGGGTLDLYLFKPLCIVPTLAANIYAEKDSAIRPEGLTLLQKNDTTERAGCLGVFFLTSGTGTGSLQGFLRTFNLF